MAIWGCIIRSISLGIGLGIAKFGTAFAICIPKSIMGFGFIGTAHFAPEHFKGCIALIVWSANARTLFAA